MQSKNQPPIKKILTAWIASYEDGKLPKDNGEKKAAFVELLETFKSYGYTQEDIESATTTRWVLDECCPPSLKGKVRDFHSWFSITEKLWNQTVVRFFGDIKLAKPSEETLARTATAKEKKSKSYEQKEHPAPDISKETSAPEQQPELEPDSDNRLGEELDRSIFANEPAPEPEWDMDTLRDLGIDPARLGVKTE